MVIGLFAKAYRTDFAPEMKEIVAWLESYSCQTLVDRRIVQSFDLNGVRGIDPAEIPARADAIVVFGGDGTMLSVARLIRDHSCPILGVNLGTLGFLTEVTLDRVYSDLMNLLEGDYRIEERCLIQAVIQRKSGEEERLDALNDVVLNKAALARVISVDAFFDDSFVANFVSDGMIVSTPTGSTAYSLSAGGPIVHPSLDSIVMTPICPHTLTNRPLVLPASNEIRLVLRSGEDVMVTIDGQVGVELGEGDEVRCTLSPFRIELIRSSDRGFFDVLRQKLNWGKR